MFASYAQNLLRVPGPSRLSARRLPAARVRRQHQYRVLRTADAEDEDSQPDQYVELETPEQASHRKRKSEWKRRQRGQSFLDHLIVTVRGGKGGDGCAAFYREKFVAYGPPSGGDGGRGGDVYIRVSPHLTTLSSVPNRVRGEPGANGQGNWLNGRTGEPTIIDVPLGTVVRSLPPDDPRCAPDEWDAEEQRLAALDPDERLAKMRARRWVHYPGYADENIERDSFLDAEERLAKEENTLKREIRRRARDMISLDLDALPSTERAVDAPIGTPREHHYGHLIASGGFGGHGNPHFLTREERSPKVATRGRAGELVTLSLELKLLADVGLVGYPNAGKSTVLRALTGGRARTEIAGYAFTTLNPVVGIVRVYGDDGSYALGTGEGVTYDETRLEMQREKELMESGMLADALTRNQRRAALEYHPSELARFSIADNPGLVDDASEDVGLGHSFLRSIERSLALAYVVDLAGPAPWDELRVLRAELEKYKPGLSGKARIVIANKADLLGDGSEADLIATANPGSDLSTVENPGQTDTEDPIRSAWDRLARLETFVHTELGPHIDVVPVSAKYDLNLRRVVTLMRKYVEEARRANVVARLTPPDITGLRSFQSPASRSTAVTPSRYE